MQAWSVRPPARNGWLAACGAILVAGLVGCGAAGEPHNAKAVAGYSNIHPADYVGPGKCAECHATEHARWRNHSHSRMNLNADSTTVVGNFDNCRVDYGDGHARFEQRDGQFFMTLFRDEKQVRQYRVTRTVGSRFTQMYIGVQTEGPEPPGHPVYSTEGKLPFGYWMKRDCWTPESYFDTDREQEPEDPAVMFDTLPQSHWNLRWNDNCIYCHNTYPYQHRVFFGEGLGFPTSDVSVAGGAATVNQWGPTTPDKLVTLGVSCESCHFGGKTHAAGQQPPCYVPRSEHLAVLRDGMDTVSNDPQDPYVLNSICAQCHCAKVSQYPNGAATWNSREALDLLSGACRNAIKCTDCHDPHASTDQGGLKTIEQMVDVCLECHDAFRDAQQRVRHARHSLESGVTCLDCHMPKIVQGLEEVVRTHHIHSPTDERMLGQAGPNACNLCHLDQSLQWTLDELREGWGWSPRPELRWNGIDGGKLEQPMEKVWLEHRFPVVRLVAAEAMSHAPDADRRLPALLPILREQNTVNRMFGLFAVERILGRRLSETEYNPLGSKAERDEQVERLLQTLP